MGPFLLPYFANASHSYISACAGILQGGASLHTSMMAKALAGGHKALDGQAGQLAQAVQILEGVGEGMEAACFQESP